MKTAIVTGANRGIGLELARQLAARGVRVVGLCRHASAELTATGVEVLDKVDVAKLASLSDLAERVRALDIKEIELLINNAGVLKRQAFGAIDDAAIESMQWQYAVNSIGPLLATQALAELLAPGAKVAIVTSRMGSVADNSSGGQYGYRMSKAAVNAAGVSLAHDLAPRGIAVALLHPGYVRTDMTAGNGDVTPAEAAAGLLAVVDRLTTANSGGFWHANGERLPW